MRDVLRAHCGRVVAWALHWWTSHWSQVRVEVCLKAEKGPNSGFCVCGVPEMAIFARNSNGAQYSAVICCGFIWIFEWFPRLSSMNVPEIWDHCRSLWAVSHGTSHGVGRPHDTCDA